LIQTTSAGTQGIANAHGADEIITGSFVNAPAIVRYIRAQNSPDVSLVCMGAAAIAPSDEDTRCAEWLRDSLEDRAPDFAEIRDYLGGYGSAQRFFDIEKAHTPARDFELCLDLGRFDFVLKAQREAGAPTVLHRVDV
jgi:2-phosphosulfolactate phosphatase